MTGVTIYNQQTGRFDFHPGPVFANIVLADEINRASPKTQSALLEVMEEGRVTVDGVAHATGTPFMVIATKNPVEQAGTYALPEAQLDRFLMKTTLGYPDHQVDGAAPGRRRQPQPRRRRRAADHRRGRDPDDRPGRHGPHRHVRARLRQPHRRGDPAVARGGARGERPRLPRRSCGRPRPGPRPRAAPT